MNDAFENLFNRMTLLSKQDRLLIQDCRNALAERFRITAGGITALMQRLMPRSGKLALFYDCEWTDGWRVGVDHISFDIALLLGSTSFMRGRRWDIEPDVVQHIVPMAILELPVGFGKVLIRRETVTDKIEEWFNTREIDFPDHPVFSKNYYVLAEFPDKARMQLTFDLRDWIAQHDDLYLEIFDNAALVHWPKAITPNEVVACARFCDGLLRRMK